MKVQIIKIIAFIVLSIAALVVWINMDDKLPMTEIPEQVQVAASDVLAQITLMDQHGSPYTLANLKGKPHVINFIFTRCHSNCTLQEMKILTSQTKEFGDRVAFLSISVDPEYDTPEVLLNYTKKTEATDSRWSFVTGKFENIKSLVIQGFKSEFIHPLDKESTHSPDLAVIEIRHSENFVLLDRNARIRLFQTIKDDVSRQRMIESLRILINEIE
ncbi:protein SCO1 [Gammaproteobacteria bacterium]